MSSVELDPRPVRPSSLIRVSRWTMLGAGVLYGLFHQNRLSKRETARREEESVMRAIKEKKLIEEKRLAAEAEWKALEAMMK